jgi:hypothetical protein
MLTPSTRLANGTTYTAQVGTAVKSSEGVPLASPVSWTFTTTSAPESLSKIPADGAANVPTGSSAGTPISATFTKPMNGNTFTTSTFTLWRPDNTQVPATPSFNSATGTATITPTLPLSYGTTYTVKLTNGITDANGIALASPVSWTFTTTATMMAPLRINAGSTSNYTDSFGNSWLADDYFKNGLTESIPTRTIKATGFDPALFRDDRYGSSSTTLWSYNIPVPNGTYDIKLYFVELTKTAIGQRVFSVDITDTAVNPDIANLDIFKEVGANAADVKTFTGVTISDSTVSLRSINVTDLPEIAAIEIIPVHT